MYYYLLPLNQHAPQMYVVVLVMLQSYALQNVDVSLIGQHRE